MRRLWILMAAVLAFGGLAALAPSAGASVHVASKPSAKFCQAVANIGDVNSSNTSSGDVAKKVGQDFKKAAKYAPSKVRSAMNTIGSYFAKLASVKSLKDLANVGTSSDLREVREGDRRLHEVLPPVLLSDLTGSTTTTEG